MNKFKYVISVISAIALTGCISNSADTAIPAPTNLAGIYKAQITGGSIAWEIFADGTGVSCEQRNSMNTSVKLRDMVINGSKAYDVFEFTISDVNETGFTALGITNLTFTKMKKLPVACRY